MAGRHGVVGALGAVNRGEFVEQALQVSQSAR
jgi:hypothetical protein